jgi:hypothetical protein
MSHHFDRRRLLTASALLLAAPRFARTQQPGPTQQIDPNKPAGPQSGTPIIPVTVIVRLKDKPVTHAHVTITGTGDTAGTAKSGYTNATGNYTTKLMIGVYKFTVTSGKYTRTQTSVCNGGSAQVYFELSAAN